MTAYPCCECCLTDSMHPDQHEVACPTCNNPAADRLRAERGELAAKLAHMREARDNARAEVERLTALIDAVRKLHREVEMEVLGPDCADETCDHEECPTVAFKACAHCYEIGEAAHWDAFEDRGLEAVAWPCPTIRALDTGGVS